MFCRCALERVGAEAIIFTTKHFRSRLQPLVMEGPAWFDCYFDIFDNTSFYGNRLRALR